MRKKNHHLVHEISSPRELTILTPCNHHRRRRKKEGKIVLDGSTMQCEKRTITSFVKYRRRENGQYLHSAIIIEEKGKKKENRVRRFNHAIRKKNHHLVCEISSSRELTILTSCNHHRRNEKIMLDGLTMQCEKWTIASFMKYRRRENGQHLQQSCQK